MGVFLPGHRGIKRNFLPIFFPEVNIKTTFFRCQGSCINSKKRKRRDVTRDKLEHEESTAKKVLTGGPMIIGKKEETEGKSK